MFTKTLITKMLSLLLFGISAAVGRSLSVTLSDDAMMAQDDVTTGMMTHLCRRHSDTTQPSLALNVRVMDPRQDCRQPLTLSVDDVVDVTYDEDAMIVCHSRLTPDARGVVRVWIPDGAADVERTTQDHLSRRVKVCVRDIGCAQELIKQISSSDLSFNDKQTPSISQSKMASTSQSKTASLPLTAARLDSSTDNTPTQDWCLKPSTDKLPAAISQGKTPNTHLITTKVAQTPVGATTKRWEDIGMDWMKRTVRRSVDSAASNNGRVTIFGGKISKNIGGSTASNIAQRFGFLANGDTTHTAGSRFSNLKSLVKRSLKVIPNASEQQRAINSRFQEQGVDKKESWDDSVMGWMKRTNEVEKRDWEDNEMAWLRRDLEPLNDRAAVVTPRERNGEKRWDDSGMAWVKRDWGDSGMAWVKRNDDKRDWGDSGMAWVKRNDEKRDWGDSGMAWVKKNDDKRDWGDSGVAWVKRNDDKRDWSDSGMAWVKRNDDKKDWGDSGMAWVKRNDNKREWNHGDGMAWIRRSSAQKERDLSKTSELQNRNNPKDWDDSDTIWVKKSMIDR